MSTPGSIGPEFAAAAFSLTPDPARLFLSHDHAEALTQLRRGLEARQGFVVLVAEVGLGKTTLAYSLLTALGPDVRTAYVANPRLAFEGLLRLALVDFGVQSEARTRAELLAVVDAFSRECGARGQTAVLVVDEAQTMDEATFESLLLLTASLQIVLVGQPELDEKLRLPTLQAVADRVAVRIDIEPLGPAESREYIAHRLTKAGGSPELFSEGALDVILRRAEGVPRRMNILCHNALLVAYANGANQVDKAAAEQAIEELTGGTLVRIQSGPLTAFEDGLGWRLARFWPAGLAAVVAAALLAFMMRPRGPVASSLIEDTPRAVVVETEAPPPPSSEPVQVARVEPETPSPEPIAVPEVPPSTVAVVPVESATPNTLPRTEPPAAPPVQVAVAPPAAEMQEPPPAVTTQEPAPSTAPSPPPAPEPRKLKPTEAPVERPRAEVVPSPSLPKAAVELPPAPVTDRPAAVVPQPSEVARQPTEVAPRPAEVEPPPPAPAPPTQVAALEPTPVPPAPPPAPSLAYVSDAEVRAFIDRYVRAWHSRDVDELRRIGQVADDGQAKALGKYFGSVQDFDVQVKILEMSGSGTQRTVRFTRRDSFRDPAGREVSKESPPIEKTIVRTPDGLRFAPKS